MRLGLHTSSYHYAAGLWEYMPAANEPMTAVHFLRKAAELRLDGVFFCDPRHFDSLDYGPAAALREQAEALDLYLRVGVNGTDPEALQEMVRAAHVLGAPTVRASVTRPRAGSPEGMTAILAATASELSQVTPLCERYGIRLAIENTPNLTTQELLALVEMTGAEWVGVCFDTGSPLVVLEDALTAAAAVAPLATEVHLKDYQISAESDGLTLSGCALGDGVVDLVSIIDLFGLRAPEVGLNVATAPGKQHLPMLEESYLSRLPQATAAALGRILRLARDRGLAHPPQSAVERGAGEDDVLAEEDDLVVWSVRWAQRTLGRPEAEDLKPGE